LQFFGSFFLNKTAKKRLAFGGKTVKDFESKKELKRYIANKRYEKYKRRLLKYGKKDSE
jgi:hypothetical protein